MNKITIPGSLLDKMVSHCRSAYPNEACGVMAGKGGAAEKIYEMTNIEGSAVSYLMDPEEQFRAIKEMRADGREMVVIYHSHPHSQAYPSPRDVGLAFYSDPVYIIVSLIDKDRPEIRAYEIVDGKVRDVQLECGSA